MTISEKLKFLQKISGLTQEKLAHKLGVSFATLNSWINNRSTPHQKSQKNIDNLFCHHSGLKTIPTDTLSAKKKAIQKRKAKNKNTLKIILDNPDIRDQFLLSLTYHTNRLEGSTLTEDETRAILFDNVALPNKNIIEQLEAKNHEASLRFLWKYLSSSKNKIDEKLILKLHGILMNGIRDDAGLYRQHGVRIVGSNVPTANFLKIPQRMLEIVKKINAKKQDIVAHVTSIHSEFEQVHPFSDGNGRIGRLIMQAMLLKNNLPPAVIKQENKRFYITYLRKSQLNEDQISLEGFICDAILDGFLILERK